MRQSGDMCQMLQEFLYQEDPISLKSSKEFTHTKKIIIDLDLES